MVWFMVASIPLEVFAKATLCFPIYFYCIQMTFPPSLMTLLETKSSMEFPFAGMSYGHSHFLR